ncbi:transporter, major facilitator family protein, partial [Cooperia oncophora]
MFAVGGMFGGLISGWLADKVGRRGGLLYNNLLAFVAAALMGLAKPGGAYPMIVLGRLFIGFYCGLTCIVPMYLAETSPTNLRGMLGSLHQLLVTIAILVSQILGLPYILGTTERWPWIFAFTVVPAVLQVITLPMIPESPKYTLCVRGQQDKATRDLKKLRGTNDVSAEIEMFREEAAASGAAAAQRPSMVDMFRGSLLWPMTIAIMMMLAQQLSGINVAMFYSTVIFKQAGLSNESAVYATIGMGTVNVIMTVISVWL